MLRSLVLSSKNEGEMEKNSGLKAENKVTETGKGRIENGGKDETKVTRESGKRDSSTKYAIEDEKMVRI